MNVSNPADRALSISALPSVPPLPLPPLLLTVKLVCVCFSADFSLSPFFFFFTFREDSAVSSSCLSLMLRCSGDKVAFPAGAQYGTPLGMNGHLFFFSNVLFYLFRMSFFSPLCVESREDCEGSREFACTHIHKHLLFEGKNGLSFHVIDSGLETGTLWSPRPGNVKYLVEMDALAEMSALR